MGCMFLIEKMRVGIAIPDCRCKKTGTLGPPRRHTATGIFWKHHIQPPTFADGVPHVYERCSREPCVLSAQVLLDLVLWEQREPNVAASGRSVASVPSLDQRYGGALQLLQPACAAIVDQGRVARSDPSWREINKKRCLLPVESGVSEQRAVATYSVSTEGRLASDVTS